MKTRFIALILVLILAVGCFSGCGNQASSTLSTPSSADNSSPADPEAPSDETTEPEEPSEPLSYVTFDYEAGYKLYDPEAVVMTVNGSDVTWSEYYSWLFTQVSQYEMYIGAEFNWDDLYSDEYTLGENVKAYAEGMSSRYIVIRELADALELTLNEEDKELLDTQLTNDAANYAGGDVDAFFEFLASTYVTEDYYRFINESVILAEKHYIELYGENGEKMSEDEINKFIDENGFLSAKHILFLTTDESGQPVDDAAKAEKLAQAEDTLAQLKALSGDALMAKFDELMNALSEDTGLAYYPDGYVFMPGEMVPEFENGTKELENYAVSDIIETSCGYHIIMRLPITPDSEYQEGMNFRYLASNEIWYNDMMSEFNNAEIVYTEEFAELDLADVFKTIELEY
ncbi:MAG: peptidylprolyl isomerase [Oscillospiraceae bacterium]|nr:peptidylprolyl isomerase [Oscillospiraceae bacterium]